MSHFGSQIKMSQETVIDAILHIESQGKQIALWDLQFWWMLGKKSY